MSTENGITSELTHKDFTSDQDIRWCPGCGDITILKAIQKMMPTLGKKKEDFTFISGIGCSSRFPYYMDTYGFHTIHGRAPAIATGMKIANPESSVWIITGDGDSLAIGTNHFLQLLRRNVNVNLLLFNNEIYGLTKGQYSPTSASGLVTKSSPYGAVETPFSPGELAMGARTSFFARVYDQNPKHLAEIMVAVEEHKGTSLVEILQNCVIFNDKVFAPIISKETRDDASIVLEHGKPMIFGKEKNKGLILNGAKLEAVTIGENGISEADILIHDAHEKDTGLHSMLARMNLPELPVAFGIIRQVDAPVYDELVHEQTEQVRSNSKFKSVNDLFHSGDVWEVK